MVNQTVSSSAVTADESGGLFEPFVLEEGRHTGARVFGGSGTVGDDEFILGQVHGARRPVVFRD